MTRWSDVLNRPRTRSDALVISRIQLWRFDVGKLYEFCGMLKLSLAIGVEVERYPGLGTTLRVYLPFLSMYLHRWPAQEGT